MAEFGREGAEVNARIVYWGIEGSGKSTNLRAIHSKLRPDHRGELRSVPTRLDPTVRYDALPIELGQIGGVRTRIQILTVPGAAEHAPTRKQLLDQVDGIVFVVDTRRERIEENISSLEELRGALESYGRALEEIPLVVQYNHRDQSDPFALEDLHRKLGMRSVAAFEAVAPTGSGVLQTLTTISKRVIRHLRKRADGDRAAKAGAESAPPPGTTQILEAAVLSPEAPDAGLEEGGYGDAALDPAILYDADHPDAAAIEATAAETEAAFEPSFRQVALELGAAVEIDPEPEEPAPAEEIRIQSLGEPAPAGEIRIQSVGEPAPAGPGAVRIPILLCDESGRSLAISLTVAIEASKRGGGD
jgi:signal recognition particle receptor subunit beta